MERAWIRAQGGDPDGAQLELARRSSTPCSRTREAWSAEVDALTVGLAATAARRRPADEGRASSTTASGASASRKRGDRVEAGQPLAAVHARDEAAAERAVAEVQAAYDARRGAGAVTARSSSRR